MLDEKTNNSVTAEIERTFEAAKTQNQSPVVDLTQDYCEPLFTVSINGVKAMPQGDLVAISAKAKSGKSYLCSILSSAVLYGTCCGVKGLVSNPKLLYFDTEQHIRNSAKLARRIHKLCSWSTSQNMPQFKCYSLRTFTSSERMNFIESTTRTEQPNFVVVDGVRDLVEDFNDISQSADCIGKLMKLSAENNLCCVCVLHQNKAKDNSSMRGHLGTELLNKCADVLEVKRSDSLFQVSSSDSRNEALPDWSFTIDEDALPVFYDGQGAADDARVAKIKDALTFCIREKPLPYSRLIEQYAVAYGCSTSTAKRHVAEALRNKFIYQMESGEYCLHEMVSGITDGINVVR